MEWWFLVDTPVPFIPLLFLLSLLRYPGLLISLFYYLDFIFMGQRNLSYDISFLYF